MNLLIYFQIIDKVQSSSSITSGILEESQRQCSELQEGVKRAKMEHTNQTSSSSSTSEHQTLLSFDEEHIPQVPHLRSIFDKRCEFDVVHLQQEHRKDSLLHVLAKVTFLAWWEVFKSLILMTLCEHLV